MGDLVVNFPEEAIRLLKTSPKLADKYFEKHKVDLHLLCAFRLGLVTIEQLENCHGKKLSWLELCENELYCARSKGKVENFRKQFSKSVD